MTWAKRFAVGQSWHVGGYWDLSLAYWANDSPGRTNSSLVDIGFTPVLRLEQATPGDIAPYLEAAVGAHVLSESSVSTERRFGTFARTVALPQGVDESAIQADYRNGVLEVLVAKPEVQKPRKIQIGLSGQEQQPTIEGTATEA